VALPCAAGVTDDEEFEKFFGEIDEDRSGTVTIAELQEWWTLEKAGKKKEGKQTQGSQ
jgi:Ca2+-binding EF-hand superfamily protein